MTTSSRSQRLNRLSSILLLLTVLLAAGYALIFFLNPLNPQGAQIASGPSPTPEPSATPTVTPTATPTARPTNTPTTTPTPSAVFTSTPEITGTPDTPTPGPSLTPSWTLAPASYEASVEYQGSIYGLNWSGIAGLVLGLDRKQQTNILLHAWGDEPLGATGMDSVSGIAPQYGVSGFEITLGDSPRNGTWFIQLKGDDGQPLSEVISIEMSADPRGNLAFVIFRQNH